MNVALVDRHPVFRTGLRTMLKSEFEDIATLETESMQSMEKLSPLGLFDIVIIGLSEEHPDIDLKVLRELMEKNPLASFIVYASIPDQDLARSLIRMGVKGYLTKHACPDELVACVRSVFSGNPYLSPQAFMTFIGITEPVEFEAA